MFVHLGQIRTYLVVLLLGTGLAGCNNAAGPAPAQAQKSGFSSFSPHNDENNILEKSYNIIDIENPDSTQQDKWNTINLEGVPTGATGVILNLAGRARSAQVTDSGSGNTNVINALTRLQLWLRSSGSSSTTIAPALTVKGYRPAQFDRNTVLVPLNGSSTIEYKYLVDTSSLIGQTLVSDYAFRLKASVQGYAFGATLNEPFDEDHLVVRKSTRIDTTNASTATNPSWNSVSLNNVPTDATAVILNLDGRATGATNVSTGSQPDTQTTTYLRVKVRTSGSSIETNPGLALNGPPGYPRHNRNLVIVPLASNNAFEYQFEFNQAGSEAYTTSGTFRTRIFVQGYVKDGIATNDAYNPGTNNSNKIIDTSNVAGSVPDTENNWNTIPVTGAPADATAVVINLGGRASGAYNSDDTGVTSTTTRLHVRLRATGSTIVPTQSLRIQGMPSPDQIPRNQTSRNTVLVPMGVNKTIQYHYEFEENNSQSFTVPGTFRIQAYVQGYLTTAEADAPGEGGRAALACNATGSPFSHDNFEALLADCAIPSIFGVNNDTLSGNAISFDGKIYTFNQDMTGVLNQGIGLPELAFNWSTNLGRLHIDVLTTGTEPVVSSRNQVVVYDVIGSAQQGRFKVKFYTEEMGSSDLEFGSVTDGKISEGIVQVIPGGVGGAGGNTDATAAAGA